MTDEATRRILEALAPYKNTEHGSNRYNAPWRPNADGGTLAVDKDAAYGLGLKWYDHKDGDAGNGWTLAERLGIAIAGRTPDDDTPYASLADYAHAHGCPVDVFQAAGWKETTKRDHLVFAFKTKTGTRYRYADPKVAGRKYDSDKGYTNCWYGLQRAVDLAAAGAPFVICNGEASTVAALHHGVAACCVTGGEKGTITAPLLNELKAAWNGPILIAFDCDVTGRKAGTALATFLQDAGLQARAVNLQGGDGFDIADYCRLHNGTSAQHLATLPTLVDQRAEIVRMTPAELAHTRPVGGLPTIIRAADLASKVFETLRWTVDGILPEGACLLAAKPKAKKSWLALAVAVATAMGGKVLGYYDVLPGDVLYLDLESNERRMQARLNNMLGPGPWPENLDFAYEWGRGDECLRQIEAYHHEHPNTRLIVIDILARVRPPRDPKADPYEQDYTFLQSINAIAERLRITIIVIHHTRKAKADDVFEEVSGTQAITGAVATIWMLSRSQDTPDEQMLHLRGRDLVDEEPLAIKWDSYTCQHILVATGIEASSSAERRKILEVMDDDQEYQLKELAAMIGKTVRATDNLLRRLIDDNVVQRTGRGRYAKIPEVDTRGKRGNGGIRGYRGISGYDEPETGSISTSNSTIPHNSTSPHVENKSASGRAKTARNGVFHEFHEDRDRPDVIETDTQQGASPTAPASSGLIERLKARGLRPMSADEAADFLARENTDTSFSPFTGIPDDEEGNDATQGKE